MGAKMFNGNYCKIRQESAASIKFFSAKLHPKSRIPTGFVMICLCSLGSWCLKPCFCCLNPEKSSVESLWSSNHLLHPCESVRGSNRWWIPPLEVWAQHSERRPFSRGRGTCSQDGRIPGVPPLCGHWADKAKEKKWFVPDYHLHGMQITDTIYNII